MSVGPTRKPLFWMTDRPKSPPYSIEARIEAGVLLRRLQEGGFLGMPHSRPMPGIGPRCHELRIQDENRIWRLIYRIDPTAIIAVLNFSKTTTATTARDISICKQRLKAYDIALKELKKKGKP